MLIAGCSLISAKDNKNNDLYMHCYACDSLGVEKTSFGSNDPIYFGFVLRNISQNPIKYWKPVPEPLNLVRISINKDLNFINPPQNWHSKETGFIIKSSEHILKPNEQLFEVTKYDKGRHYFPFGYKDLEAVFSFNFEIDKEYHMNYLYKDITAKFVVTDN
jgi:hypothetical protein